MQNRFDCTSQNMLLVLMLQSVLFASPQTQTQSHARTPPPPKKRGPAASAPCMDRHLYKCSSQHREQMQLAALALPASRSASRTPFSFQQACPLVSLIARHSFVGFGQQVNRPAPARGRQRNTPPHTHMSCLSTHAPAPKSCCAERTRPTTLSTHVCNCAHTAVLPCTAVLEQVD